MTTTLHDRLARLADESSPAADVPTGRELWSRGLDYRRRRRSGSVAIVGAGVVLLVGLLVASFVQSGGAPAPAGSFNSRVSIPSEVHVPSPWLPGTAEAGPIGQLIAVMRVPRGRWDGESWNEVVGISAADSTYRFLDLPDLARDEGVSLSPDGRHVAYWESGIDTLAVYDVTTEEVQRHSFESDNGLLIDSVGWADDGTVLAYFFQREGETAGVDGGLWAWDLESDGPVRQSRAESRGYLSVSIPTAGRRAVKNDFGWKLHTSDGIAISPDGTRVAGFWNVSDKRGVSIDDSFGDLAIDELGGGTVTRVAEDEQSIAVQGWVDDDHVALLQRDGPSPAVALYSVDSVTGERARMVGYPDGMPLVQWASDLLGADVVERPAPPTPLDPRVTTGLAGGFVLLAGIGVWEWRRRVRP